MDVEGLSNTEVLVLPFYLAILLLVVNVLLKRVRYLLHAKFLSKMPDYTTRVKQVDKFRVNCATTIILFIVSPILCSSISYQHQATALPEPFFLVTLSMIPDTHTAFFLISSSRTSPISTPRLTIQLPLCICVTKSLHHSLLFVTKTKTLASVCITGKKADTSPLGSTLLSG
ncbi:hypothetical protein E4T39_00401 [Aureobasidium subglaciale]|nr:hypothetical protein E4T39_00401 [Aureobasidium subglaciale]